MLALIGIAAMSVWPGGDAEAARALVARDDAQRLRAVLELARAELVRATALLVPALRDRAPDVRLVAGRLLARRGSREATRVATAWLGDASPRGRLLGLLVLRDAAELPDEARRAVERALRNGDVTTRLQGLELLAARPEASSFGAVVALLEDEIAEIRLRALRALAAIGDARATLAVTRRLADADRGVRLEAATTLGALGDRRAVPALLRQLQTAEAASDPHTAAVDALGRLGDPAALSVLARLAGRSPRDDLARHAALALGALGTPAAVEALLALAREPPGADDVRLALERVGARAVPRLCEEVATGSPTSARLAVETLGRLADRRATGALVASVERGTGPLVAALEALARLADPAAVPALVRVAMDGPAPELRGLALEALEATGGAGALVALPRALADADATVRARAARLAGRLGDTGLAPALAARLRDSDVDVRRAAARALARLPSLAAEVRAQV
ncbi:MAG TPA: HEAT repeat domain-containing protein, partial [Polyangia bacterium]|nr:HEAT repeat domain-containing protein [Polyangia bacterium]